MKKVLCFVLSCALLLSVTLFASADSDLEAALAGVEIVPPSFDFSLGEKSAMDRATFAVTSDVVSFSDADVSIQTESGINIRFQYPNEYVLAMTQDLVQQAYLYIQMYQNAPDVVASFVEEGMHLNIFDQVTGADIFLYAEASPLAGAIQDLDAHSEANITLVQDMLTQYYFGDASSVSVGTVGGNLWFFADYGFYGVMLTFVNGVEVDCMFKYVDSDQGPVTELTLLNSLTISAV